MADVGFKAVGFRAKVPTLLDRALIGLLIFVVLVLLGMEMIVAGGPTIG
jgi:hypothetical protein